MSNIAYAVYDTDQRIFLPELYDNFIDAHDRTREANGLLVVTVGDEHIKSVKAKQAEAERAAKEAAFRATRDARAREAAREAAEQAQKVADAEAAAQAAKDAQDAANAAATEAGIKQPFPAPAEDDSEA